VPRACDDLRSIQDVELAGAVMRRVEKAVAAVLAAVGLACAIWAVEQSRTVNGSPSALPAQTQPAPRQSPVAADKPALPHDDVAAAAPTKFTLAGSGFTVTADVCGMDPVFPLDPPGDQLHTVCWVTHGFGVAPGSTTPGTTYVLGHAWAAQRLVLNPLSEFATAHEQGATYLSNGVAINVVPALKGYQVTLQTPTGTLGYTVKTAFLVGKLDARGVASLMRTTTPNRVVIITCAVANHVDLPQNVIVYADLAWSKAKH
jgi:hypothetical protein